MATIHVSHYMPTGQSCSRACKTLLQVSSHAVLQAKCQFVSAVLEEVKVQKILAKGYPASGWNSWSFSHDRKTMYQEWKQSKLTDIPKKIDTHYLVKG